MFSKSFFIYLISLVILGISMVESRGESDDEIVELNPWVTHAHFDVECRIKENSEEISEVEVTWISSGIQKKGLRAGDRLISIDGESVVGMNKEKLLSLLHFEGNRREHVFVFKRKRFLLGQTITVTFPPNGS